ncbi:phosphoenolpyruvate--protein phosphotransferase [Ornithinimicrobium sp. LYQ103]|uniref:phosphoenolpyruvate--protein phosphotransferase n=1 Tax=Ornithinimicrobium sp. LYQ103 TaxID=3378796 RepID=UPI003854FAC6
MIALVVVSHSRALASAAVELATQMVTGREGLHVGVAAGLDGTTLGTDAGAVAQALVRADEASAGAGVLVLLDLGSAVLSAEMALELVPPEVAGRVRLSPAPVVEGLVAAVVAAASGADLHTCAHEAEVGLAPKIAHLGCDPPRPAGGSVPALPSGRAAELSVVAEHGLHARPAARLVGVAAEVAPQTRVMVRNLTSGRGPVDALSLSGVATLDARQGHVLLVEAEGPRAAEVLGRLSELAASGFGDLPAALEPLEEATRLAPAVSEEPGIAGSGLDAAIGPVVRIEAPLDPDLSVAADPDTERRAVREAVKLAVAKLGELAGHARRHLGEGQAEVFEAHAVLLSDPQIHADVEERIAGGASGARAWSDAVDDAARRFADLPDPYQRERGQDVHSIGERVLRVLMGAEEPEVLGQGVLVVDELDPALAISLNASTVQGVITRRGGGTGHGVLIASSRGVPVLTGAGDAVDVPEGTIIAFDVRTGILEIDPDDERRATFETMLEGRRRERRHAIDNAHVAAATTDGLGVAVRANVSSLAVARLGAGLGAEGSGLVRTEAVFAQWRHAPSVEQQTEVYAAIADAYAPHPVTIRTWDVGGDKSLPFIPGRVEHNPFLGARGVRAFAADPALLLDQLEAICRVAVDRRVRVMFPMVTTADDVVAMRRLLERAAARAGLAEVAARLDVGIMVEVPAAALRIRELAADLDFVSIGSNDLAQYTLAAERGNTTLSPWSDPLEPAVLQLVRHVADHLPPGVVLGVCGAMAADPDVVGLLVGLGVHELSASAATVPMVKERLRTGSARGFRELADRALTCRDAAAVRELLHARIGRQAV